MSNNEQLNIEIDKNVYDKEAVLAALHRYSDKYFVTLDSSKAQCYLACLEQKDNSKQLSDNLAKEFLNEVLEQQMRINVERDCGKTRDLIVEKAFSPLDVR
jgi:His-Xaa-Ser system protein HxsD